eukprot:446906-Prymnesium_polylepis.1
MRRTRGIPGKLNKANCSGRRGENGQRLPPRHLEFLGNEIMQPRQSKKTSIVMALLNHHGLVGDRPTCGTRGEAR